MARKKADRRRTSAFVMIAAAGFGAAVTLSSSKVRPPALTTATASPAAEEPTPAKSPFGDAELRGRFSLAARETVDDRVEVPLDDGRRAVLTLDPTLQEAAEALIAEADAKVAAIVVMSVDGRLLALAGNSTEDPTATLEDVVGKPWAPSASIFKIVTTAALVDAGVAPDTQVCYHGGLRSVEDSNLKDDARLDGACNSLSFALSRSQNAIIAKLVGEHLDAKALGRTASLFGYGQKADMAIDVEIGAATLPEGPPLEVARAAAGFWHSELSPVGGAVVMNTIASGGRSVTPRLVASVIDAGGEERAILPRAPTRVLDEETAKAVGDMMIATTEVGTARKGFTDARGRRLLDARVAGKTGSLSRKRPFLDYSWFVGYAPAEQPAVVVSVLLGNDASYRFKAHTVARLILERALSAK